MDRSRVIYLIGQTYERDPYGVNQPVETRKKVFCNVMSVTASEWFDGGRNGLNPEYRMIIFQPDYNGEKIVEYNGTRYTVYRTYEARNDSIELYVERRKGADA